MILFSLMMYLYSTGQALGKTLLNVCNPDDISFVKDNESLRILQISLSMGIRFIAGVSIKVILTMVAELYPTPIRSTTMGIGAMASAIGAFFGLLIESLALIWSPLPLLVIGILATLAFILCFFIPETKNEPLPETIEDAINIGSNKLHNEI